MPLVELNVSLESNIPIIDCRVYTYNYPIRENGSELVRLRICNFYKAVEIEGETEDKLRKSISKNVFLSFSYKNKELQCEKP